VEIGGAAGFFAAIACAEKNPAAAVTLYEATAHPLAKVRISGGGRCNVTHACFEPRELVKRYPRGGRELLGAFHRWSPRDTIAWFEARGVELKTEADGRMFPITDDSPPSWTACSAPRRKAGVEVRTSLGVRKVERWGRKRAGTGLLAHAHRQHRAAVRPAADCDGRQPRLGGAHDRRALGHAIEPLVPSLFTFHIDDKRLEGLSGIAVESVVTSARHEAEGGRSAAHHALGPERTRRSETLGVGRARTGGGAITSSSSRSTLCRRTRGVAACASSTRVRTQHPRKQLGTWNPLGLPARFWERLLAVTGIAPTTQWAGWPTRRSRRLRGS
jgi:predicted flavoprotein YhiN